MLKSAQQIRAEIKRLESGIKFANSAIIEFEDDPHSCHTFIVSISKYQMKIRTLKWVLNES